MKLKRLAKDIYKATGKHRYANGLGYVKVQLVIVSIIGTKAQPALLRIKQYQKLSPGVYCPSTWLYSLNDFRYRVETENHEEINTFVNSVYASAVYDIKNKQ